MKNEHLQQTTVEQSPATQSAAHLGAAVHHEALQVAQSHLNATHLTGCNDSARNRLVLGRQLEREMKGKHCQCQIHSHVEYHVVHIMQMV